MVLALLHESQLVLSEDIVEMIVHKVQISPTDQLSGIFVFDTDIPNSRFISVFSADI